MKNVRSLSGPPRCLRRELRYCLGKILADELDEYTGLCRVIC